jgi:hypothetical protein
MNNLLCPTCKNELSTGASQNGKARFFCTNPECTDRFKVINNPIIFGGTVYISELREAVARGWTHPDTKNLTMDPELAEAIVTEVSKLDTTPNLGCATTFELINELHARADVAKTIEEEWPNYKTVNS